FHVTGVQTCALPISGEHTLPSELMLTSTDFSHFWGHRDPMWDDGPIPVRLLQVGPNRLSIRPPASFPGTLNEWLWDEHPPILHDLLSSDPDPAIPTGRTDHATVPAPSTSTRGTAPRTRGPTPTARRRADAGRCRCPAGRTRSAAHRV